MPFTLSNPHLHFTLDPAASSWSLFTQKTETPSIEGARFNGLFRFSDSGWPHLGGLRTWQWAGRLDGADISSRKQNESPHGPLNILTVRARSGLDALAVTVEFALPTRFPFLLIRLRVANTGSKPFRVVRLNPLFVGALHHCGSLRLAPDSAPLTFFSNGWQSWSFAGALTANRTQPRTRLKFIQTPLIENPLTPTSDFAGQFSSDMFGVLACPSHRAAIVAGFIAQREQFGSVDAVARPESASLRVRAQCDDVIVPPGGELLTDWAYLQLLTDYGLDPLADYGEAVARENSARVPAETPVGWCSWYHYFNKATEADVRSNLGQIAAGKDRLPLSLIQLDDGFQQNVGDWFVANGKFPSGLRALADSIRGDGFTPGLWLAPFIARPDSEIARHHPDWFLRNRIGLPANAGFVFDSFARGLDVTHPAAQDHLRRLISTAVNEWGFPYLKLDFVYAAALPGARHDATRTRAQAMRLGLELIREAAGPQTFLLGCGCPLGSAVGLVDAMRVSADVEVRWRPQYRRVSFPFRNEPGMPSARNAIRNDLARAPLHRRWWLNDPDCLLMRGGLALTLDEQIALATVIALSGGMFFVSDDMAALTDERRKMIEPLLPVLGKTALARDWLEKEMPEVMQLPLRGATGEWTVFGIFNWEDRAAARSVPVDSDSHLFDFWTQTYHRSAAPLALPMMPPHSGRLFAVRPVSAAPQFIGSSLHFSQGGEVTEWEGTERGLRFVINLNRVAEGFVTLALPHASRTPAARLADGIYRLPIEVNKRAEFTVEW
ncbi:MAG: alpha-galactosidase [Chloroflexi bacterium]|nr:alpha-galactosidase [Chloroflexota bacterium]